jgi:ATP-dependent exoDNAse (exonuclease V) beta subunit
MMEDDINNEASYPVENFIDDKAVTIMTMHKSKGLEYPAVICPFIDVRSMPWVKPDTDVFFFDGTLGLRCTKVIGRFNDYTKICDDWRTVLARGALDTDYSEERRLMFVALSRAKQFETVICGPNPSSFMKELADKYTDIPDIEYRGQDKDDSDVKKPEVPPYKSRRMKIGIHEILDFSGAQSSSIGEEADEVSRKGMEYGTRIHQIAQLMCYGHDVNADYEEIEEIRKVLDSVSDATHVYAEIDCGLPLENLDVTLRGVIDMLAVYEDHVEIHDYKTDISEQFEDEYRVQLSIY